MTDRNTHLIGLFLFCSGLTTFCRFNKRRENKHNLEYYVTSCVIDFLSDKNNAEVAIDDVLKYYDKRTDETNLKSITAQIVNIIKEVEKLTDAFVNAKSVLLQNSIEKKMSE